MSEQRFQFEIMDALAQYEEEIKNYEANTLMNVFNEVTPCESCCDWNKCKHKELACEAFHEYVIYGRFRLKHRVDPSVKIYNKVFLESVNG